MKKLILIGAVAFVVSVGAAIGARMLLFPPQPPDPGGADSTSVAHAIDAGEEHPTEDDSADPETKPSKAASSETDPADLPARELPGGVEAAKALETQDPQKPVESETTPGGNPKPGADDVPSHVDSAADSPETGAQANETGATALPPTPESSDAGETRNDSGIRELPKSASLPAAPKQVAEYKTLARILASMKPAEAAKILAYLDDEQVEGILRSLRVKQVASLLSVLPTERAAVLSQRLVDQKEEVEG